MKTSPRGQDCIKADEALRLVAYFCIAGRPTISWGVTDGVTSADVYYKRTITVQQAQQMFDAALLPREQAVERLCTVKPTQNQFDAMVSLVYNIGAAGFAKSTVLRLHNQGDFAGAALAFALWNKATVRGKLQVVPALVRRRAKEAALYLEGKADDGVRTPEMPQKVDPPAHAGFIGFIVGLIQMLMRKKP